jgi:hypothetical protein
MLAEAGLAAHVSGSDVWHLNILKLALTLLYPAPNTALSLVLDISLSTLSKTCRKLKTNPIRYVDRSWLGRSCIWLANGSG